MPIRLALLLFAALGLLGCGEYTCENVDGTHSAFGGRQHCDSCGAACAFYGVADAHHTCLNPKERDGYACGLLPGWRCEPGYFDLDDAPGCECYGRSADDCQPCGAELPFTGLDEDCDLRIDEAVPNDRRFPHPPNGPAGALPPGALAKLRGERPAPRRDDCGGATCALTGAAADVRCVVDGEGPTCRTLAAPVGEVTRPLTGGEEDCTDGLDGDGNGVIDDGPRCQTLVPSVSTPECHGRTGAEGCPPAYVPLDPEHLRLWGSDKPLVATMTYDILVDRAEATLGQVQRFLVETGRCDNPQGKNHPLCDVTDDPALPAGGLDWCAAYDYCRWAGKRLPTELEWLRTNGGTTGGVESGADCADGARTAECGADGPRPVGRTGGHTAKGQDGESIITDVIGNVAEWVYDARIAPCDAPWADCSGPVHFAVELPTDPALPAPADDLRMPRILRGGGWASEFGAASVERRQYADPAVEAMHYGVRCVQTFRPVPASLPDLPPIEQVPYDSTISGEDHAKCEDLPQTERVARRTPPYRLSRAVEACVRGVDSDDLDAALRASLADRTPLLVSVTDEGPGAATMAIETGLVPGAEAFWLKGRPPNLTLRASGCHAWGCRFDRSTEPGLVTLKETPGRIARLPFLGMSPIAGAIPTCLPPTPFGETAWRLDLRLPTDEVPTVFGQTADAATACAALRCADDDVAPQDCARDCTTWRLPVDVQMQELRVP